MKSNREQVKNLKEERQFTERAMAQVIMSYLQRRGYKATCELVLGERDFDIRGLTRKELSKVRIDIAAHKEGKITFIEIENGLWLTHPVLYRPFAHRLFVAFPEGYSSPVDKEQLQLARAYGIGAVMVHKNGLLARVLESKEFPVAEEITAAIIRLIEKKRRKEPLQQKENSSIYSNNPSNQLKEPARAD